MKVTLNTSIASLGAQRQLGRLDSEIGSVFERLSTGLRINRAADDPAGLSIAEILKINNTVLNQGVKNLNDGISLLNIADTAVQQLTTITSRIMELAEQAANGTLGYKQRQAIDNEGQELSKEFTRIVQTTEFNGIELLNGGLGDGITLQAGFGEQGQITGGIGDMAGSGDFQSSGSFGTGISPFDLASGDFNGDGILDVVAADFIGDTASVLIGRGDGTFATATSYIIGSSPASVATGDFNGDGILDLVTSDAVDATVSILTGIGDGTFSARQIVGVGNNPRSVSTGDLNGDGYLDIVTADSADDTLSVLLGSGNGTFSPRQSYGVGALPMSVHTADVDGDGILDLLSADATGDTVSVLTGLGDGTFSPRQVLNVGNGPSSVSTADFNGDGHSDIFTANVSDDTISILLGTGDGTFSASVSFDVGGSPDKAIAGDFDGDGILNIATVDRADNTASVLSGRGDGTFSPRQTFVVGTGSRSIITGDFNGDGVLDLASTSYTDWRVNVLLGNTQDGTAILNSFSLATQADALQAMAPLRNKLDLLNQQRGEIGAFQGRIEAGMRALEVTALENKAAEARIRDADVATETAKLVRLQIAQQAAAAVLAQANTTGAIALQLIGG